jgi:hypothetical protein
MIEENKIEENPSSSPEVKNSKYKSMFLNSKSTKELKVTLGAGLSSNLGENFSSCRQESRKPMANNVPATEYRITSVYKD